MMGGNFMERSNFLGSLDFYSESNFKKIFLRKCNPFGVKERVGCVRFRSLSFIYAALTH